MFAISESPQLVPFRDFATMAVLATGQTFAPLFAPDHSRRWQHPVFGTHCEGGSTPDGGADKTARLWDPITGRQIALLRRADEQVIDTGLSPDGATAFTHSFEGVLRLWETKDGAFRVAIDPRTGRVKSIDAGPSDHVEHGFSLWTKTRLSNDRVLTYGVMFERIKDKSNSQPDSDSWAPLELWDAHSGRFMARLGQPKDKVAYEFFGNGRFISSHDYFGRDKVVPVFSTENGQLIARLKHDEKHGVSLHAPRLSPSGHIAATVTEGLGQPNEHNSYVHFWDTSSWQLGSTTGPIKWGFSEEAGFQLIADDLFTRSQTEGNTTEFFQSATASPIVDLPGSSLRILREVVFLDSGQLLDIRTRRRLQPPKARKYHPEITRLRRYGALFR